MLTIGQLAAYAGVTVRAVRFYHQKGLLPEPERDDSGYRRYDAGSVVELIRIRTLADAGVPLARIGELLTADAEAFAAAIEDVDRRLQAEIREKRRHRERIAQLAAGDSLALPPEAVAYLERMRGLGFSERVLAAERDAWILVAAKLPDSMPAFMASKHEQLEDPATLALYRDMYTAVVDWERDDPRLPELADRLAAIFDAVSDAEWEASAENPMDDDLVELLDSMFLTASPIAGRLRELLEERGWRGWTKLERIPPR